jgi:DMSO/TMAO reductase YedYZ molybdopterin-dependent catalytic subunit
MTRVRLDAEREAAAPERPDGSRHVVVGSLVGLLSAGAALGAAELAAGIIGGGSSPIIAVGEAVIDATPEWLKTFAIRTFGSNDKLALLIGIGLVMTIAAVVIGMLSVRRPRVGAVALVVFGGLGAVAAVTRPANGPSDAVPSIVGAAVGLVIYLGLRRAASLSVSAREEVPASTWSVPPAPQPRGFDRRRFLWTGLAVAGLAGVSGGLGRLLIRRADASESRASVRIPAPADPEAPPPAGADLEIQDLSSFITPNDRFYRVDTALFVPAVQTEGWQLSVHGMVDRELTLNYEQLLARPLIERDVTLTCVSNEVGGSYVGNARWIGARLKDVLDEAGVQTGATQLASRSTDGFTVGTPTAVVTDGRDAMLAVAMNGEPLPLEHGFPVRMVVPGLYGYVSATKWLVDLELTTFEAYDAYWVQRGWAQEAPIKTESRIDTPRSLADLRAGEVAVAGVAWAQHRGIEMVEVQVDDGPWIQAQLAAQDTVDTWRQWLYRWGATAGRHSLSVRATDGEGTTQTPVQAPPFPDGATGYHTIAVDVS